MNEPRRQLVKIVSGGQTGVDRAALDVAMELGIPHGGWCPKGRRAEDGPIPPRYRLRETESPDYASRTDRNVADSDGTFILYRGSLQGGTALTRDCARRRGKPLLAVDLEAPTIPEAVREWLKAENVHVLNVAGPRESQSKGIATAASAYLRLVLDAPPPLL